MRTAALSVVTAALLAAPPLQAKTLRYASAFDPQTMDPHSLALLYHTRVISQIYDGLVHRGRNFEIEPALALSWQMIDAKTWRFKLRPGVRFHDGTPFTADDAVFSIERALAKNSQRAFQMRGVTGARKVDDLTIDILLAAPDAALTEKLLFLGIMSKAWAQKHDVLLPQDFNAKQETHAVRHANGTGPFRLKAYETDGRTVLSAHPGWWGQRGNVTEVIYTVINADATRLAALASGQVDFVIDPPFQDIPRLKTEGRFRLLETTDIGTQYLAFDQSRPELEFSDVKGRNPFKDLRVRKAIYQAIDIDLIVAKVLRGQATPTGSFLSRLIDGVPAGPDRRLPYDPAAARTLLREAGYADGFGVTLDCVNTGYRAAVCQAITGMLAQVGIRVTFQPSPSSLFFPKLSQALASFIEYGWSPGTDAWPMLNAMVRTHGEGGLGSFNAGRYSNSALDKLIDAIRTEPDLAKRRGLIAEALTLMHADLPIVPLYRRTLTWAMRPQVNAVMWPNDTLELRFVSID